MKKKFSIIVLIIGCVSLILGISLLIINQNNNKKAMEDLKVSIVNDYENFKIKIESFSEERVNVYENLNQISYLTDLPKNYDALVAEYDKYAENLKEIEESSKDLKVNCYKHKFTETDINNKVSAFTINYEQAINYYIQDVNNFNEKIKNYNEWIVNNQLTGTYEILEEYEITYKEYVDINGDGVYNGVNK